MSHFQWETNDFGEKTGVLRYQAIQDKNHQGGDRPMPPPKDLERSSVLDGVFIDLYAEMTAKRPAHPKDDRVFLQPNDTHGAYLKSGNWYKTQPVGEKTIGNWFKETAQKIGIATDQIGKRFTNQSLRSTLVTLSLAAGGNPHMVIKLTGHGSI